MKTADTTNDHLNEVELFIKVCNYMLEVDSCVGMTVPYKGELIKFVKNGTVVRRCS